MPVFSANVVTGSVTTGVDNDSHDNKDLDTVRDFISRVEAFPKLTIMVMILSKLSQYSTSPYARTVIILARISTAQKMRLRAQPGKFVVQYSSNSWRATRSEAVETASLNQ